MSLLIQKKMEVVLYNSTVCRLCGEENDNGTLLYSSEENSQNLSDLINTYLPIKVSDDGQLPRTICPGCTIQLEATVEFLNLIITGQKVLRDLHQREREYKKTVFNSGNQEEVITEKIVYEVNTSNGVYQVEHPIALQVAGLEKPKRKRGRPPKKQKTPEELAAELANRQAELKTSKKDNKDYEPTGKRRRKTPTRFKEAVQGKELEKIFIEEGVIDEESDHDLKPDPDIQVKVPVSKEPEVIGHMENSGELVVVVKGKGRGRPKGRMRPMREQCAICGMEFSCGGRYMSHIAQHGPVLYQCVDCSASFTTKLTFAEHQQHRSHRGLHIIPAGASQKVTLKKKDTEQTEGQIKTEPIEKQDPSDQPVAPSSDVVTSTPDALPDLDPLPVNTEDANRVFLPEEKETSLPVEVHSTTASDDVKTLEISQELEESKDVDVKPTIDSAPGKEKLKCNYCDKTFSSRQTKSMHIKATHQGERAYACAECGAAFAYPRSLALHAVRHRRGRPARGYACDLCGKVLNHPSSVVYHKEAEHAGQRYVCNKCGKCFKHKQLLQRHQLVHSALRPYTCKTCNATFKTKANLLNHQLLHSGVKKFSCDICKQRFAHKTSLTLHMRWHTGQKPYSCETCGKSFSQKGNLSEHQRIHTGEKPFQCAICPRRFTTSSQHRLHARRHNSQQIVNRFGQRSAVRRASARTHVCGACGDSYSSRGALLAHARTHARHDDTLQRCTHCPRAFADRHNLNKHKKQVHKQVSLLATSNPQTVVAAASPALPSVEVAEDELEERVIYVTYDVDEADSPAFHIIDPEQPPGLDETKVLTTCELYPGPSLLMPQPQLQQLELPYEQIEMPHEQLELHHEELEVPDPMVLDAGEHMPVTDEQGNPLHFTMQDGTRLAITSADGKSLQVITQDGQTIPVEINGFAEEEEVDSPDTIVHQLNLQKSIEANVPSPVTHYFTIV